VDIPAVTSVVIRELKLKMSQAALASEISADAPSGELLINVHVLDRSPTAAARICNFVAQTFAGNVAALERSSSGTDPVQLTVTRPATTPGRSLYPRKPLDITVGALTGLLIGFLLVALRALLDRTVRSVSELKQIVDWPLLGAIPHDKKANAQPLAFRADSHGPRAEGYRQLRTNLQFIRVDSPPRIIAVTSASPDEGKSLTTINLAAALAEAGRRVCVIEADLRRPTIARTLGLVGDVGLTSVLTGNASLRDVMQNAGRNLVVMASGPIPPNPSAILLSKQFKSLVAAIADQVDFVVLDTAPLLAVADGAEIASIAEAILLVVRSGKTRRDQILRAVETLQAVSERPVGTVLNRVRVVAKKKDSYNFRPEGPGITTRRWRRGQVVVDQTFDADAAEPKPQGTNK
jgi:non-specific protein-tyrosine kinase